MSSVRALVPFDKTDEKAIADRVRDSLSLARPVFFCFLSSAGGWTAYGGRGILGQVFDFRHVLAVERAGRRGDREGKRCLRRGHGRGAMRKALANQLRPRGDLNHRLYGLVQEVRSSLGFCLSRRFIYDPFLTSWVVEL